MDKRVIWPLYRCRRRTALKKTNSRPKKHGDYGCFYATYEFPLQGASQKSKAREDAQGEKLRRNVKAINETQEGNRTRATYVS